MTGMEMIESSISLWLSCCYQLSVSLSVYQHTHRVLIIPLSFNRSFCFLNVSVLSSPTISWKDLIPSGLLPIPSLLLSRMTIAIFCSSAYWRSRYTSFRSRIASLVCFATIWVTVCCWAFCNCYLFASDIVFNRSALIVSDRFILSSIFLCDDLCRRRWSINWLKFFSDSS